jgi:hypothetical protein
VFIFLEAFSDPFGAVVEAASQSSPGTRAKLHKVEAVEEVLTARRISRGRCLPGASANSSTHDASFVSTVGNPSNTQISSKDHLP